MCITRDRKKRTLTLDQCVYAEKVLKQFGMLNAKPTQTPLPSGYNPKISEIEATSTLRSQYQSVIGSLLYIMLGTRLDLAFAVIHMSQFCANPSQEHLSQALYIYRKVSWINQEPSITIQWCKPQRVLRIHRQWLGSKSWWSEVHHRICPIPCELSCLLVNQMTENCSIVFHRSRIHGHVRHDKADILD